MSDELIRRMEKQGRIRKQEVGLVQIEALLRQAIVDLEEAKKVSHIAERATYLLAYMAMLKAGRAPLLLNGYAPADGGQHRTVVEITSALLGKRYRSLTDHFETMRRKRNEMTYEAGGLLSMSEGQEAFGNAVSLVDEILKIAKARNPQLELEFGID